MQPTSFLVASAFGAVVLGLLTGAFGIWCGSRYGETERRYIIQYVPALVCVGLFLYVDFHHHMFWTLGIFNIVYFSTALAGRRRNKKKHTAN
jgi:high-affinity Fe2+/Pb2+ permease